jgi:protein disulfide-isomerase A1
VLCPCVRPAHAPAQVAVALFAAALAAPAVAKGHYWFQGPSNASELTPETFAGAVGAAPQVVVEFYNPGCGYCRSFGPEYERAIVLGQRLGMTTVWHRVNCDDHPELYVSEEITMFPTFKFYVAGEKVGQYVGTPLLGEGLLFEARQALGLPPSPAYRELGDALEAGQWLFDRARSDFSFLTTAVAFVPAALAGTPAAAAVLAALDGAGVQLLGKVRTAVVRADALVTAYRMPSDAVSVALYKDFDEGKEVYSGEVTADALAAWLRVRSEPIAVVADGYNVRRLQSKGAFLLHLFTNQRGVEDGPHRVVALNALRAAGKALEANGLLNRGEYVLTIVDAEKHASWLKPFYLDGGALPSMGLLKVSTNQFFSYQGTDLGALGSDDAVPVVNAEAVVSFVRAFLSGLLRPLPPLPEEMGGPEKPDLLQQLLPGGGNSEL